MTLNERLMNLLEAHATDDFYVGSNIPKRKLENAIVHFPIDPKAIVIALIDCTVMGSCKNGLAITAGGLVWKNNWTSHSSKSYLSWKEFLDNQSKIAIEKYDILLGDNLKLNMSGSRMNKLDAFNLFHALSELMTELLNDGYSETNIGNKPKEELPLIMLESDFSDEDKISYKNALITGCVAVTMLKIIEEKVGKDDAVELVSMFICEEELIEDKQQAVAEYNALVDKLSDSFAKSMTLFKLQFEKILTKVEPINDKNLANKLKNISESVANALDELESSSR